MTEYRENPACQEQRTPEDVYKTLNASEQRAYKTMTHNEIIYLYEECGIKDYIQHLRKGDEHKALGEDFPILVIKGSKLQLERYKVLFLLSLIDYNGVNYYYPSDFALGEEVLDDLRKFTGVAIVRIAKGTATSEGLDAHRSELITGVVAARRDFFNPTLILAEESIAGKLTVSSDLIKVVFLDPSRLGSSYDGSVVMVNTESASRVKATQQTYIPHATTRTSVPQRTNNDYNNINPWSSKGKNANKRSVSDMANESLEEKRREMDDYEEAVRRAKAEGRL